MQLRQKYTIGNISCENELFISEKDNVNIIPMMEYFFSMQKIASRTNNNQPVAETPPCSINENNNNIPEPVSPCEEIESEEASTSQFNISDMIVSTPSTEEVVSNKTETETDITSSNIADVQVSTPPTDKTKKDVEADYFVKYMIGKDIVKSWMPHTTIARIKSHIYNKICKLRKKRGYNVDYEILTIKPMTEDEFLNGIE